MKRESVPFLDLTRIPDDLRAELHDAAIRVIDGGRYVLGPEVESFEAECARYLGVAHAVGVSSGSDALLVALMALGVGPGDEVVCPAFTFFATAGSIARTGATPVFADSALEDFNCDPAEVLAKVTPRTKAIVPVHLFGRCADVQRLAAGAPQIAIVEDAAQAFGASAGGRAAGAIGDFGCFSFFPSKNLGAFGDAGLVTTNDAALAETARVLRSHGAQPKYHHAHVGGNFRLDALQAALLRPKLRRLDGWTAARQRHATLYGEIFAASGIAAPNIGGGRTPAPLLYPASPAREADRDIVNQYCLRITDGCRDALRAHLQERGIGTEVYYPVPMHLQKCFASLGYREGGLPRAELLAKEAIALPIFPELTPAEIEHVAATVIAFFR